MKTFLLQQITSRGFDWKLYFLAGICALLMLIDFVSYPISTGKHWYMPILLTILVISNFRAAYQIRKKIKKCEPSARGDGIPPPQP